LEIRPAPIHQEAEAMDTQQERELVARAVRGDAEAYQLLAGRYYRPVAAFLFKRVARSDVVEDLAQETFLEAFRALRDGARPDNFSSWLFGIAHNRAGKWLRRKKSTLFDPHAPPATPTAPSDLDARAELEEQQRRLKALDASLAGLPDDVRQLLEMKHKRGLTCEQIAAELSKPVGTIKSLLSRTYKLLRERLAPLGTDEP
jgi:RNA polymerase sigma-70 factor, ECF subfamily